MLALSCSVSVCVHVCVHACVCASLPLSQSPKLIFPAAERNIRHIKCICIHVSQPHSQATGPFPGHSLILRPLTQTANPGGSSGKQG